MASSIEWLQGGETWNPIRARLKELYTGTVLNPLPVPIAKGKVGWMCVKVSPGCEGCYAEAQNVTCGTNPGRNGTGQRYAADKLPLVELFLDEKTLLAPLHWKKPRLIFPCSMTDWMADFVPDEWRDKMLAVMNLTPQHTYLTLTKRADRQLKYFTAPGRLEALARAENFKPEGKSDNLVTLAAAKNNQIVQSRTQIAAPNQWRGVSAENQEYADKRIPELLETPAALRWVSLEPLLGPIDFYKIAMADGDSFDDGTFSWGGGDDGERLPGIDWGVIGLESGSKARAGNIEWIRQLILQFHAAGVPVFVKQLGAVPVMAEKEWRQRLDSKGLAHLLSANNRHKAPEGTVPLKMQDPKGGDISEWPKDLQVRQYPLRPNQCNCSGSWHAIGSQGCTMEAAHA